MKAKPFKIQIPQATLDDLRARLARTRYPAEANGAGWDYGVNLKYLKKLMKYWERKFDWRAQEDALNRFAHFRAKVDDLRIHFIHERGQGPAPIPLLLTHGWPDSFARMLKVIPLLTDPAGHGGEAADAFDVIVPSLPGYGFSDKPKASGTTARIADYWAELMTEVLGYERFGAAGGDIGSGVTQELGQTHADLLMGLHLTDVPWQNFFIFGEDHSDLSEAEQEYFVQGQQWMMTEGAYASIQSTKPQTAACGLNDSPAGLAAWIVEKFYAWSDCNGDLESRFTKDELLTNVTIYWATETIGSSFLYYYEPEHGHQPRDIKKRVEIPTGFALFPKDLTTAPREWAERFFNVQRWTQMPRGGHFAALEEPELLAAEMRHFFRPLRSL